MVCAPVREIMSRSPLLKITKNIGFLSNTGPDTLTNHKAIKPISDGVSLVGRRLPAYGGTCIWILPLIKLKKNKQKQPQSWTPYDKTVWIRARGTWTCLYCEVFHVKHLDINERSNNITALMSDILEDYLPVHTHKPYNNLTIKFQIALLLH